MTSSDIVITRLGLRFLSRQIPCMIGRSGITSHKNEGDSATPRGIHSITGFFYRPDRVSRPSSLFVPIRPRDLWSDDVSDPSYNLMVQAPHEYRCERLTRSDPLYDVLIVINWNWPIAISGKGSAIFLHQWRRCCYPTEGCIAVRRDHLIWIARRVCKNTHFIIN
ncbi:MAG: L,D-transpeptidase family protein [Aestuariivita sp.]|nr:L,D-transpeptidase family protein [Aestuariivita sp.]